MRFIIDGKIRVLTKVLFGIYLFGVSSGNIYAQDNGTPPGIKELHQTQDKVSSDIPLDDPVYQKINQLSALNGLDSFYSGERPISRQRVSNFISKLQSIPLSERENNKKFILSHLDGWEQNYISREAERRFQLRSLNIHYLWLDQPARPITETSAVLIPFLNNRSGRSFDPKHNIAIEGSADYRISSNVVLGGTVRGRLGTNTGIEGDRALQNIYIKFRLNRIDVQIGRNSLNWGHGFSGSLGLSNNAKPFESIKVSNGNPFTLPWYLKYLGPIKGQVFLARLDKDRLDFAHPYLFSLHVESKPTSWLEIGGYRWMMLSGAGSKSSGFDEFLTDLFLYRVGDFQNRSGINNAGGLDIKIRLPFFNGMFLYTDTYWEDVGRAAKNGPLSFIHFPFQPQRFSKENANKVGISIPNLLSHGRLSLDLEQIVTANIIYRHGIYTSGFTHEERLMGHDLGPDGHAGYLKLSSQLTSNFRLTLFSALERRGDEGQNPGTLPLIRSTPGHALAEWRYRLMPGFLWRLKFNQTLTGRLGYERVNDFNYIRHDDRENFMVEFKLQQQF